jgi:hypothetical protein
VACRFGVANVVHVWFVIGFDDYRIFYVQVIECGVVSEPKLRARSSGFGGSGYRIPTWLDDKGQPMLVPSVTTITGVTNKPGLQQWIADQTAAYAVTHIDDLLTRTEEVGWGFLRYFWKREPKPGEDLRVHTNVC